MFALIFVLLTSLTPAKSASANSAALSYADTVKRIDRKTDARDTIPNGRFVTINRIFITGNRITRDRIIQRELSFKGGDIVFTGDLPSLIDLDRKKLLNTRLFNTVEIRTLELEPFQIDIIVNVNERWYAFPVPILELSDRNFNDWWQNYGHDFKRINYGMKLYQYNMRGRNETLRLHAQWGYQRRFEVLYRFPYIDQRQKNGLSFDFIFTETKNLAFRTFNHKYQFLEDRQILRINRFGGVSYTHRHSFYQTHAVRLEYMSTSLKDTVRERNELYLKGTRLDQHYLTLSYSFNSDHRDFVSYPLKGHQFTFQVLKNGFLPGDNLSKIEGAVMYSKYVSLGQKFFLSNNTVGYASNPDDISYLNYGTLGLRKQFVRGYELYVIEGPFYFINKATFKKQIFARNYNLDFMPFEQFRHIPFAIYLKTYADVGYVKNYPDYEKRNLNTRLSNKVLAGAGFGVDVVGSYDLVFRFEYSFNAEGERGFFFHIKREF
jgi:outer membrane protein assembly factor BamA